MSKGLVNIPWYYKGQLITKEDVPEGAVGIVYRITRYESENAKVWGVSNQTSISPNHKKIYIGKKLLTSTTKRKLGVRAKAKQLEEMEKEDKRKVKRVVRIIKDSGWMKYNSSCTPLQIEIQNTPELFHKEILHWCYNRKYMSYMEIEEMIKHDVLRVDSYNENMSGTYFKKDIVNIKK